MKKNALILFLLMTAIFAFAGCGPKEGEQRMPQIGIAIFKDDPDYKNAAKGFIDGLKKEGLEDGKNIKLLYQISKEKAAGMEKIVESYIEKKVDLIFTTGTAGTLIARKKVKDIPVVFTAVYDPVSAGIVKDWVSSDNNFTGNSCRVPTEKQFELLREILPDVNKIGILFNPEEKNSVIQYEEVKKITAKLDMSLHLSHARNKEEVREATMQLVKIGVQAIFLPMDTVVTRFAEIPINISIKHNIVPFSALKSIIEKGAVFGYAPDFYYSGKELGAIAKKILSGTKPAEISVSRQLQYSMIINLAYAKKIKLQISDAVLGLASEVIKE